MGRIPKLNDEIQEVVIETVRLGGTYRRAATAIGVTERCLHQWFEKGRKGGPQNERYVRFLRAVKAAEAEGVKACLAVIRKAALNGTWAAAAWLLERRYPSEYGRVQRMPAEYEKTERRRGRGRAFDEEGDVHRPAPIEVVNSIREIYGLPPKQKEAVNASKESATVAAVAEATEPPSN